MWHVSKRFFSINWRVESGHTEGVVGVAQRMFLWCGLWEPDVTTVAAEVARLDCLSDIFLDDDGATGSVDEPRACEN